MRTNFWSLELSGGDSWELMQIFWQLIKLLKYHKVTAQRGTSKTVTFFHEIQIHTNYLTEKISSYPVYCLELVILDPWDYMVRLQPTCPTYNAAPSCIQSYNRLQHEETIRILKS